MGSCSQTQGIDRGPMRQPGRAGGPSAGLPQGSAAPHSDPPWSCWGCTSRCLLPEASLCPISWGLINSSPPHPVRKQVCAEPGSNPELNLSMPLAGLGGRGPIPTLISGKEAGGAPITSHFPTSTHFPRVPGPQGSRIHNRAGLMYDIYKRQPTASPLLPQSSPWGVRLPGAETFRSQLLSSPRSGM